MSKREAKEYDPTGRGAWDLTYHCIIKGVQAGAVVGAAIAAGRYARGALSSSRQPPTVQQLARTLAFSQGWGILGALLMEAGVVWGRGVDKDGFEDRAYRLHYNPSQNRTDLFCGCGYAAGAVLGAAASGGASPVMALGGGGLGCAAAVIAHVATLPADKVEDKVPDFKTPA